MEVLGRWVNIVICIVCLTIVPVQGRMDLWREELESYLIAETELLKYKIQKKGALTLEDYQKYQSVFDDLAGDYEFGIVIARRYVMPAEDAIFLMEDSEETELFSADEGEVVFWEEEDEKETSIAATADFEETVEGQICEYGHSYFSEDGSCPYCALTLDRMEIRALRSHYQLGEELELEITLYYQDGREEITEEWVSSFLPNQPGEQQVTVFCRGLKEIITVYVEQEGEICPFCGEVISETEFVCVHCYYTPVAIFAEGSAEYGEEPEINLKLIYQDGHYQVIEEGFSISGFHPYEVGVQSVEIRYREFSCQLLLEIEAPTQIPEDSEKNELVLVEPEPPALKLIYRKEIEKELEINEKISLGNENFFNIFVEKCNVLSRKSVIFYRGIWKEDYFYYTTGGEAR